MFSKALFKQSWKANWVLWTSVTIVSCFVLLIIMILSGGDGLGSITSSFVKTFTKDHLTSEFQNTSINYNIVTNNPLKSFDEVFLDSYVIEIKNNPYSTPTQDNIEAAYITAINAYQTAVNNKINQIIPDFDISSNEYLELMGVAMFTLNPNGMMNDMYENLLIGSTPPDYDIMSLIMSIDATDMGYIWTTGNAPIDLYIVTNSLERNVYRFERSRYSASLFFAGNVLSPDAKEQLLDALEDNGVTEEMFDSFGFDFDTLLNIANSAIINFRKRLEFEITQIDEANFSSHDEYLLKINEISNSLQESITASLRTKIPEELSSMMSDMEEQDMYTLLVGSIYFKIVGLLISIVFVIVVGNNLISGQVDSGSMAYILSTGTKRNTVTFTQMIFYVSSLLLIFVATSIVSIVCFLLFPPDISAVTMEIMLLFNAGAFLACLALAGINFLASCLFNRSRKATALGGGIAVITLVFTILGMFGSKSTPSMMRMDALNFFNKISIASLFDLFAVVNKNVDFLWKFAILGGIALICFSIGIIVFKKKDLPL